ncbi:MAG: hypothetical protein GY920_10375 [Aliivibrio sp.]|nr:hypothetical protein [Aliivibrio sp.]
MLSKRRYINEYPVLDVTALHNRGYVKPNTSGESSCKSRECVVWAFSWRCMDNSIRTAYRLSGGDYDGNYQHEIELITQSVNYGGSRFFLVCPCCNAKRKQIYFVSGNAACRTCNGLHYQSQSESHQDRKYRKLDRLLSKVNNFGYRFDGHYKNNRQHWRTFEKLNLEINAIQQSIFADIGKRFGLNEVQRHFF